MQETGFKIEVYDKEFFAEKISRFLLIALLPYLILYFVISLTYTRDEFSKSTTSTVLFYLGMFLLILQIVYKTIRRLHSIGPITYFTIKNEALFFLNQKVALHDITRITITIIHKRVDQDFFGNNFIEIKTKTGKHELGLLINNEQEIDTIEALIKILRLKNVLVIYERSV